MEEEKSGFWKVVTSSEFAWDVFKTIIRLCLLAGLIYAASRVWKENGWFSAIMLVGVLMPTALTFKIKTRK